MDCLCTTHPRLRIVGVGETETGIRELGTSFRNAIRVDWMTVQVVRLRDDIRRRLVVEDLKVEIRPRAQGTPPHFPRSLADLSLDMGKITYVHCFLFGLVVLP